MPIKTLMFDLDDTLVIERAAESASFLAACESVRELGGDPENASRAVQEIAREFWEALPVWSWCDRIGISPWEGLWGDFSGEGAELGILRSEIDSYRKRVWSAGLERAGIRDARIAEYAEKTYRAERARRHEVYPGVHETLAALRERFTLVLLTNGAPEVQREKLGRSGLAGYCHHIVISGELGFGKPDRRIFEHALKLAGSKPSHTLMVGDNLVRDIDGAAHCGIKTVWVTYSGPVIPDNINNTKYIIWYFSALREITGTL
jgi:putative hydrolase of the HAD superfamily